MHLIHPIRFIPLASMQIILNLKYGIEYIFLSAKLAYDIVFIQKGICVIL